MFPRGSRSSRNFLNPDVRRPCPGAHFLRHDHPGDVHSRCSYFAGRLAGGVAPMFVRVEREFDQRIYERE